MRYTLFFFLWLYDGSLIMVFQKWRSKDSGSQLHMKMIIKSVNRPLVDIWWGTYQNFNLKKLISYDGSLCVLCVCVFEYQHNFNYVWISIPYLFVYYIYTYTSKLGRRLINFLLLCYELVQIIELEVTKLVIYSIIGKHF